MGYFCIRDDDTNFFTSPQELELRYGDISRWGPVSLAVIPFCRAGDNLAVPEKLRGRGSIHPLHENRELVTYLQQAVRESRFEIMLHGYHHDTFSGRPEFTTGVDLPERVSRGRDYLETVLQTKVRVFVPPHNAIGRDGLKALARHGLHLAGAPGMRGGWPVLRKRSWALWQRLREWRVHGGAGIPWILDLGDHREIYGNAITPVARREGIDHAFDCARKVDGVFCAATHYWELDSASQWPDSPSVGEQLRFLIERVRSDSVMEWRSVGDVVSHLGPVV